MVKKYSQGIKIKRIFSAPIICCLYSISTLVLAGADSDHLAITEMLEAVSMENLRNTVADLQENRDMDPPYRPYNSRYCLRVRDTSDPSDEACDNAAEYIASMFAGYGLDVEYDPFIHEVKDQGRYTMRNIVATLPGKGPGRDKVYIISSHYDSTAGLSARWMWDWKILPAPGADDNASGTATVIEAARVLSRYEFNSTIKFIAFSGEELGMFGSKHYASIAADSGDRILGVLDLDMLAYDPDELDIDIIANADSQWLANAIYRVGDIYNVNLIINRIINSEMVYSDHSPFWKSGYGAVLITEASDSRSHDFSPVNHTADDTIDKLNFELALRSTRLVVATLAQLADPLTGPDDIVNPDLLVEADSVRFSYIPSGPGNSVTITASVLNLGPGDIEDVNIQMWLVPPETKASIRMVKEWILDLKENVSYEISAVLTLDEWGDYQVFIGVNPDSRIFESDFSNNLVRETVLSPHTRELCIADLTVCPNPVIPNENEEVYFKYKLSQDATVAMGIYDVQGSLVYSDKFTPGENGGRRGPNNNVRWSVANRNLKPVASGVYVCRIVATNDSGEKQWAIKKLAVLR